MNKEEIRDDIVNQSNEINKCTTIKRLATHVSRMNSHIRENIFISSEQNKEISKLKSRMTASENSYKETSVLKEQVKQIHRGLYGDKDNKVKGMLDKQNDLKKRVDVEKMQVMVEAAKLNNIIPKRKILLLTKMLDDVEKEIAAFPKWPVESPSPQPGIHRQNQDKKEEQYVLIKRGWAGLSDMR